MTVTKKPQGVAVLNTRMERALLERARAEARERRIPLRAIVESALRDRYDPEREAAENMLLLKEVRALRNDVRRVDFGNRVLTELSTLTTKNLFSCLPAPTPAGKAAGEGFYNALLAAVERVFSEQTPLLDKLTQNLMAEASSAEFDALADALDKASE